MISLIDLIEAEYMSEDFDNNVRGGFREHKELLEEKDRPVPDTKDLLYYFFTCLVMYLYNITGLHKKFPEILTGDTLKSFQTYTEFAQFLTTNIHYIFKAECIAFFYCLFLFSFSLLFFLLFFSSLLLFSLFFFSFLFFFFSFLTIYVVIKMVKTEKNTRTSLNIAVLDNNIQDIVKELNHTLVDKSSKIKWLLERLEFYTDHSVLVFSSWYYSTYFSFFY
jgi:hypothetical protein